jgi:hypothetical protein
VQPRRSIDIAGFLATFGFYPQIYLKSWPGMEGAAGRRERMAAAAARAQETGPDPATSGVTGRENFSWINQS